MPLKCKGYWKSYDLISMRSGFDLNHMSYAPQTRFGVTDEPSSNETPCHLGSGPAEFIMRWVYDKKCSCWGGKGGEVILQIMIKVNSPKLL